MSDTLWYYAADVDHIAKIMRDAKIFEPDGGFAWFTSSSDAHQIGTEDQQLYRIQVSRQVSSFSSYKELELRGKTDPKDQIKAANPEQWFGTSHPVFSDKWTSVEKFTSDGWVPVNEREKQRLRDLDRLRDVQKTLQKPEDDQIAK